MDEKMIAGVVKSVLDEVRPRKLTLEIARRLIHKVEAKAKEIGV